MHFGPLNGVVNARYRYAVVCENDNENNKQCSLDDVTMSVCFLKQLRYIITTNDATVLDRAYDDYSIVHERGYLCIRKGSQQSVNIGIISCPYTYAALSSLEIIADMAMSDMTYQIIVHATVDESISGSAIDISNIMDNELANAVYDATAKAVASGITAASVIPAIQKTMSKVSIDVMNAFGQCTEAAARADRSAATALEYSHSCKSDSAVATTAAANVMKNITAVRNDWDGWKSHRQAAWDKWQNEWQTEYQKDWNEWLIRQQKDHITFQQQTLAQAQRQQQHYYQQYQVHSTLIHGLQDQLKRLNQFQSQWQTTALQWQRQQMQCQQQSVMIMDLRDFDRTVANYVPPTATNASMSMQTDDVWLDKLPDIQNESRPSTTATAIIDADSSLSVTNVTTTTVTDINAVITDDAITSVTTPSYSQSSESEYSPPKRAGYKRPMIFSSGDSTSSLSNEERPSAVTPLKLKRVPLPVPSGTRRSTRAKKPTCSFLLYSASK